jgi:hypothetical protein
MTMQQIVAHKLQTNGEGVNYTVAATLSPAESKRNYGFQKFLHYFQGLQDQRVVLPNDTEKSQPARDLEQRRQTAEPWKSVFMVTQTDKERENNISQQAYMKQRRLVPDNTYGSFYAFMHALSAAFGQLHGS